MNQTSTRMKILIVALAAAILGTIAATVAPQLSYDEQTLIVDSVLQTLNPTQMAADIALTVEANLLAKLGSGAGMTAGTTADLPTPEPSVGTTVNVSEPSGPFTGLHAKFVNSYAYTTGESDENGGRVFSSEYVPNTLFNFDVVFENDGTIPWPTQIEMRNTGSVSTYTGHRPSVIVDTSADPVMPGERQGFTISAHGSEELGYHTFFFQLYDAISGSIIAGGSGSFSYLAK